MEEGSLCDFNHLSGDTRLPPRKRLLAGLKKQNSDCASSSSSSSSPLSSISNSFSTRIQDLLNSRHTEFLTEEIVDASRSAALAATKVAAAARARAEEKAAVAAKAIAAAKNALELVEYVSQKSGQIERYSRKNKLKKHVHVDLLYKKQRLGGHCETDEKLARKLHQSMNSSPRTSKGSVTSELKIHNHYKHKKFLCSKKSRVSDSGERLQDSVSDRIALKGDANSGISSEKLFNMDKIVTKERVRTKAVCSKGKNFSVDREAELSISNDKYYEGLEERGIIVDRKRGKTKQKKQSLSLCAIRDRESPKEDLKSRGIRSVDHPPGKCVAENVPPLGASCSSADITDANGNAVREVD